MKPILKPHRPRQILLALGLTLGAISLQDATAAIHFVPTVNFNPLSSLYDYSYTIQNTGAIDLVQISLFTSSSANVTGISPATGFDLTYDPFAQILDFRLDQSLFTEQTFAAGTTTSPFRFQSPLAPGQRDFIGYDEAGTEFTGTTIAPVPEPSITLLGGLAIALTAIRRRR
jgi:hypothetical protein